MRIYIVQERCLFTNAVGSRFPSLTLMPRTLARQRGKRAKVILEREVIGKSATCTITKGKSGKTTCYDRVIAVCRVGGSPVGDILRQAGVPPGAGRGAPFYRYC